MTAPDRAVTAPDRAVKARDRAVSVRDRAPTVGGGHERGSGTVLVLGLVAVVLVLVVTVSLLARTQSTRGAVQAAADLGALAGARRVASAGPAAGCAVAQAVVAENGAVLTSCEHVGDGVVRVTASRDSALGPARASARAGPRSPADERSPAG